MIDPLSLNREKRFLLNKMESTHENMFITGKAGTGKSYLLRCFLEHTKKNTVVVAPTGIAALNVHGSTIHRFFGLKPELQIPEKIDNSVIYGHKRETFKNLDTLVIDEISMVRSDLMDTIDYILKRANGNNLPFGGKQVLVFGDLYQLPPVLKDNSDEKTYILDHYGGAFFFDSPAVKKNGFKIYELKEVFRQEDENLIEALNHIREGSQTISDLDLINSKVSQNTSRTYRDDFITLTTTNKAAKKVNEDMLRQIKSPVQKYWAWIEGEFPINDFPTERCLELKVGARVIMLNNDMDGHWVNGTMAVITACNNNSIDVEIEDTGKICTVYKNKWEEIDYIYNKETKKIESQVVGEFNQIPVKLAWAITIHKSQGKTYQKVEIDLGNRAFACGQTYVAISRIKDLNGLHLKRPIRDSDILVSKDVKDYMAGNNNTDIETHILNYQSSRTGAVA